MSVSNTSEFSKISGIYNFHSSTRNPGVVQSLITNLDAVAQSHQLEYEPIRVLLDFHNGLPSLNHFFRHFIACLQRNPILNSGHYAIIVESEFFMKLVETVLEVNNFECEIRCYEYHDTARALMWLHRLD